MKAAILTFHAVHRGNCYAENDHTALDDALRELSEQQIPVRPLHELVNALGNPFARWTLPPRFVALTSDDGELGDVETMPDVDGNPSVSFAELQGKYVMTQKKIRGGGVPHLTSFVIASKSARLKIRPNGELTSRWWRDFALSGLGAIENHSWDHCHPDVSEIIQRTQTKGSFTGVDTYGDADKQIRQAARLIDEMIAPRSTSLFAYPYGDTNDYLVREYFPEFRHQHRMKAAFTCEPAPVHKTSNRWALPRYVCGLHWKSNEDFRALLKDAGLLR